MSAHKSVTLILLLGDLRRRPKMDAFGACDAFVKVKIGNRSLEFQTDVVKNSLDARFPDQTFELDIANETDKLEVNRMSVSFVPMSNLKLMLVLWSVPGDRVRLESQLGRRINWQRFHSAAAVLGRYM